MDDLLFLHQRQKDLFWGIVATSRAALALADARKSHQTSGLQEPRVAEQQFLIMASAAIKSLVMANGDDVTIDEHMRSIHETRSTEGGLPLATASPTESDEDGIALRFFQRLAEIANQLKPTPKRALLRAAVQLESVLRWLLGEDVPANLGRRGVVLFASSSAKRPTGSLARLEVRPHQSKWLAGASDFNLMASDIIHQGLLIADNRWHQAFDLAAVWANTTSERVSFASCHTYLYSLNFCFRDGRAFLRPSMVQQESASLAAAVLARAAKEGEHVDSRCCYVGAIGRDDSGSWTLDDVAGVGSKNRATTSAQLSSPIVLGALTSAAKQEVESWGLWSRYNTIQNVNSPEQAFDFSTQRTQAVRRYVESERLAIRRRVAAFTPPRIYDSLGLSLLDPKASESFACLDDLTLPQDVERISGNVRQLDSIDIVIQNFLDRTSDELCLKLLAGPGMGKTWVALRFHLKQLHAYWRQVSQGGAENRQPTFSVWLTAVDLQKAMVSCKNANTAELLCEIILQRMSPGLELVEPDSSRTREQVLKTLQSHIASQTLVLLIDGWDERDRQSDLHLIQWLDAYFQTKNLSVLLSRRSVEVGQVNNPFTKIKPSIKPWALVPYEEIPFARFAKRWFGDDFDQYEERLVHSVLEPNLSHLVTVPQVASIVCWLLKHEEVLESKSGTAQLIESATQKTIEKSVAEEANSQQGLRDIEVNDWRRIKRAAHSDGIFQLLSELAYHTFDGRRWGFELQTLKRELDLDCYRELLKRIRLDKVDVHSLATYILSCGIFTASSNKRFEVIHQVFAEVLMARRFISLFPIPKVSEYREAEEFIEESKLLEAPWTSVISHFADLSHDTTDLLELLFTIRDQVTRFDLLTAVERRTLKIVDSYIDITFKVSHRFDFRPGRKEQWLQYFLKRLTVPPTKALGVSSDNFENYFVCRNLIKNVYSDFAWTTDASKGGKEDDIDSDDRSCAVILFEYEFERISGDEFRSKFVSAIENFRPLPLDLFIVAYNHFTKIGDEVELYADHDADIYLGQAILACSRNLNRQLRIAQQLFENQFVRWETLEKDWILNGYDNSTRNQAVWLFNDLPFWLHFIAQMIRREREVLNGCETWNLANRILFDFFDFLESHIKEIVRNDTFKQEEFGDGNATWLIQSILRPHRSFVQVLEGINELISSVEREHLTVSQELREVIAKYEELVLRISVTPNSEPKRSSNQEPQINEKPKLARRLESRFQLLLASIGELASFSLEALLIGDAVRRSRWASVSNKIQSAASEQPILGRFDTKQINTNLLRAVLREHLDAKDFKSLDPQLKELDRAANENLGGEGEFGFFALDDSWFRNGVLTEEQFTRIVTAVLRTNIFLASKGLIMSDEGGWFPNQRSIVTAESAHANVSSSEVVFPFPEFSAAMFAEMPSSIRPITFEQTLESHLLPFNNIARVELLDLDAESIMECAGIPEISEFLDHLIRLSAKARKAQGLPPFTKGQKLN